MTGQVPVLYSFRRCPYAMRARLALQSAQQTVELREIELKAKPAEFLMASPKATVPVLITADGVLEQSLEIMLWALRRNDPLGCLPDTAKMEQTLATISENDGDFKHHLDRYKYPHRYQLDTGLANRDAGATFLRQLNSQLLENAYLAGKSWGLLDAAVAPFVRQYAHTDANWFAAQDWQALQHWLQAFEASDAFNAVMKKFAPWKAGEPSVLTHFEN
jgi:glutathione S-transferase